MSEATDKLRAMLDERGVECGIRDTQASKTTLWTTQNGGWMFDCDYMEPLNEKPGTIGAETELMIYGYTPEQAIAATLGNGTCQFVVEDNMGESEGMGDVWFRCTNCNAKFDYYADEWLMAENFCPSCGAKVVRE